MNTKVQKTISMTIALAGLILLLFVIFIKPACLGMVTTQAGKEVPMRCHYTSVCLIYIAALIIIINVIAFITNHYLTAGLIDIVLVVMVFMSTSNTLGMGLCGNLTMQCHSMASFAKAISIVIGILAVIVLIKNKRAE